MCRSNSGKYIVISRDLARKLDCKKHTKKIGCREHINSNKDNSSKLKVTTVHMDHNHDLDPDMSSFNGRSWKQMTSQEYEFAKMLSW